MQGEEGIFKLVIKVSRRKNVQLYDALDFWYRAAIPTRNRMRLDSIKNDLFSVSFVIEDGLRHYPCAINDVLWENGFRPMMFEYAARTSQRSQVVDLVSSE
jgi:hypothetical protein